MTLESWPSPVVQSALRFSRVEAEHPWREAGVAVEDAGEVALGAKAHHGRHLDERHIGAGKQLLRTLDPLHQDVQVRRLSGRSLEHPREMEWAQMHCIGQLIDVDR